MARLIKRWLEKHAYWDGSLHSSWILPPDLAVGGICGTWNDDVGSLDRLLDSCNTPGCNCAA